MSEFKKNQTALITGASKRIGREIAVDLAQKGFDLFLTYNQSQNEAVRLKEEIEKKCKVNCEILQCDLAKENGLELLLSRINKIHNLTLLINNASIFEKSKFISGSKSDLENNLNLHLISPLRLSQQFAKHVLSNGISGAQIINMVDKNIVRYDTRYFYYTLSKKFLAELTKMLALELAPQIRINAIAPGFISSEIGNESGDFTEKLKEKIPLKRIGESFEIAQAVGFLLENKFITGQVIFIDGGASLNHAG